MCNLYSMTKGTAAMRDLVGAFKGEQLNLPSFDAIYPKGKAPILRDHEGEIALEVIPWGVPLPANPTKPVTNVRNLESNFWRSMLTNPAQRCLVPVTRFCEWEGETGSKRKVWFAIRNVELFCFAGIWRYTRDGPRYAFLTCEPNETVGAVHPKAMPVILPNDRLTDWLRADWSDAAELVKPYPDAAMVIVEREA